MATNKTGQRGYFPMRGWIGLALMLTFWYLNWSLEGLRTHWGFFPLWLGYCLLVDALCFWRKSSSLISRGVGRYVALFVISAPAWWLFELINETTQFWHYSARDQFSDLEYFLFASLSFSTVIPAMFGTSELVGTFRWFQKSLPGPRIGKSRSSLAAMILLGMLMFACIFVFPQFSAAFVWVSIYLMLDPVNYYLGNRTLVWHTGTGNWQEVYILWTASLICGFFWEMWNYCSSPKWYYTVPYVDFWHVFEMPLAGYLGYFPFALELFALYHLVAGLFRAKTADYLQLTPQAKRQKSQ